jgi:hypothetical protein
MPNSSGRTKKKGGYTGKLKPQPQNMVFTTKIHPENNKIE